MTDRWEAFTEQEITAIMIAFSGNMIATAAMADERQVLEFLKAVLPMMDEMSARMGVETDGMRNVRDLIAKIEEHRQ